MRGVAAGSLVAVLLFAVACSNVRASHTASPYGLKIVARGLTAPIGLSVAPGQPGLLYVVERPGRIVIVRGAKVVRIFLNISAIVKTSGSDEQGLLSVAFSPGYARNHRFYIAYTDRDNDTRVVAYRSRNGVGVPSTAKLLLLVPHPYANHNGGDLQFGPNGYLYVGTGDGGSEDDPNNVGQNLSSPLGKLFRINPLSAGSKWQMVAYGLRNPWRYSFDRATGDLWIGDVGQDTWEEVDYRPRALLGTLANYGWSVYEGRSVFKPSEHLNTTAPLVQPIYVYKHVDGACAIIGGYVYRGKAVPSVVGRYFFGDYCNGKIWSLKRTGADTGSARLESFLVPQLSAWGQDAKGNLYAASLTGTIYELTST